MATEIIKKDWKKTEYFFFFQCLQFEIGRRSPCNISRASQHHYLGDCCPLLDKWSDILQSLVKHWFSISPWHFPHLNFHSGLYCHCPLCLFWCQTKLSSWTAFDPVLATRVIWHGNTLCPTQNLQFEQKGT